MRRGVRTVCPCPSPRALGNNVLPLATVRGVSFYMVYTKNQQTIAPTIATREIYNYKDIGQPWEYKGPDKLHSRAGKFIEESFF